MSYLVSKEAHFFLCCVFMDFNSKISNDGGVWADWKNFGICCSLKARVGVSRMDIDNEQERLKFANLKIKAGFSNVVP